MSRKKLCQFEDVDKKQRYDTRSSNGRLHEKPSQRKVERGKNDGTYPGTRFPQQASYFKKMRNVCQKHGGTCTTWCPEYERYGNGIKKLESRATEKGAKKLVSSDVAKILEKESSDKY
jgi:hypothetical protein